MADVLGIIVALFVLIIAAAIFLLLGQYAPLTALTGIGYLFVAIIVIVVVLLVIYFLRK